MECSGPWILSPGPNWISVQLKDPLTRASRYLSPQYVVALSTCDVGYASGSVVSYFVKYRKSRKRSRLKRATIDRLTPLKRPVERIRNVPVVSIMLSGPQLE